MKTFSILIVLFFISNLFGCNYKNELQKLEKQNQNLASQVAKCDSLSDAYLAVIKDVEAVIDSIMPDENASESTSLESKFRTRLDNKLTEINNLLHEKEKNYQALSNKYANSIAVNKEMSTKIKELNRVVREKEIVNSGLQQTIKKLEQESEEQSSEIESLIQEKQKLNEMLEMKTDTMNTVFYLTGSEDELRGKAIIEKTGGFLGLLGRVNTLNPKLDESRIEMIDIREKKTFTLNSEMKNIEFITNHHPGSYDLNELNTGTTMLTITDPDEFWKNSRYLIIAF